MSEDEIEDGGAYDVNARDAGDYALLGDDPAVNPGFFSGRLAAALTHATTANRADAQSGNHPWIPRGPRNVGGRIRTIVQDPREPRRFFAGSAFGGIWVTENSGETWQSRDVSLAPGAPLGGHIEAALPFGALGLCHNKPEHIYAGTGEPVAGKFSGNGLYYSDDGGARFTQIAGSGAIGFSDRYEQIIVDPWDENCCWIATPDGLFRRRAAAPHAIVQDVLGGLEVPPLASDQDVTDVAIDFGTRDLAARPAGRTYTVYVALRARQKSTTPGTAGFGQLHGGGLYRATYDPAAETYTAWERLHHVDFPFPVTPDGVDLMSTAANDISAARWSLRLTQRIKLSICETHPDTIYMVAGLGDHSVTEVFRSDDAGTTWRKTAVRPDDSGKQAYYDLFVAAHPDDPEICITGSVDVWRTLDGGQSWTKIVNWHNFRKGERGEHADQHALIYDRRDPRRVWLANDHGISESRNLGEHWRLRSFGIRASQLYDLTTHPTYPWIMAGGFQDNGSWLCYGGTSWLYCGVADGGAVGFMPGRADTFLVTTQGGIQRARIQYATETSLRPDTLGPTTGDPSWGYRLGTRLADRPTEEDGGTTRYPYAVAHVQEVDGGYLDRDRADIFGRKIKGHPTRANHYVTGERALVFVSGTGDLTNEPPDLSWTQSTQTGTIDPDHPELTQAVTAIAYAGPPHADTDWWVGTEDGKLFFTDNAGASWHEVTAQLQAGIGVVPQMISDIQVHPRNRDIVAVSHGRDRKNVSISADARSLTGAAPIVPNSSWATISHATTNRIAGPGTPFATLPDCPVTRVVFDGDRALGTAAASDLTLYVATMVGVYVSRNVRADGSVNPDWGLFSHKLPLMLVRDLEYSESHNDDTTPRRRVLRVGSFGRGVYECDLSNATPPARLYIRNTAIEDSYDYIAGETIAHDPRLTPPGGATVALDLTQSVDIRIDAPPYQVLGEVLDAVEFDEDLRSDTLVLGETNFIYVQVHSRGHDTLADVDVHLYYAAAPGTPPIAPDLNPTFWDTFPAPPPGGANWSKVGDARMSELQADQPRIFRFEWLPPTDLGDNVALLAIATHANDTLIGLAGPDQPTRAIHPHAAQLPNALAVAERRAGLYITPTTRATPDVYIRDGLDDPGQRGAVAWGGRGADIMVTRSAVGDPEVDFADITDLRPTDRVRGGEANFVYVRAFNGANVAQTVQVDVYAAPFATLADARTWTQVGTRRQIIDLAPRAHGITFPITWDSADIADPAPGKSHKSLVLIALVGSDGDPMPEHADIRTLAEFWALFRSVENANNAAFRAILYEEP